MNFDLKMKERSIVSTDKSTADGSKKTHFIMSD